LTEEQGTAWFNYRRMSNLVDGELERQLMRDSGMPNAYYAILTMLTLQPEHRLLLKEMARRLGFSQSRLSHALARMEEAGWLLRERCETNRRSTYAVLTDAGRVAQAAAAPGHVAAVRETLLDALTDEQVRQLGAICAAVLAHLAARAQTSPGEPHPG
jgi:DNA-binding MarR family transcriptional regulator